MSSTLACHVGYVCLTHCLCCLDGMVSMCLCNGVCAAQALLGLLGGRCALSHSSGGLQGEGQPVVVCPLCCTIRLATREAISLILLLLLVFWLISMFLVLYFDHVSFFY